MKEKIKEIIKALREYDGQEIRIMEICGSHTAAISKSGIRSLLSPKIKLISGPGCPVCVTPSAYIDKLIELSKKPNTCVVSFGDMLRVPGSKSSLSLAKGEGGMVLMVYSPIDVVRLAQENPETEYVFAAVGFETTTPLYADLIEELIEQKIMNVKLLTALKTMPAAVDELCKADTVIDGFLAPGHVCSVSGSNLFVPLAKKYSIPFVVGGFEGEELLLAIYALVKNRGKGEVLNYYPKAVSAKGNVIAQELVNKYFVSADACWRGLGMIEGSGMIIRDEFSVYDAGSQGLTVDVKLNEGCKCGEILTGKREPGACPLFGKLCTPLNPQGACMVSEEGSCRHAYHG